MSEGGEVLYPVAELAELWRCSRNHIYDLIAARELRCVQLGTKRAKTRIPESAAAEFLSRRTYQASALEQHASEPRSAA